MNPSSKIPSLAKVSPLLALTLGLAAAHQASAGTEHWNANPGVSATTNWTDTANWAGLSSPQTYFNQVQFTGVGAVGAAGVVNNVLDSATGIAQMPIWELDYFPTNANYTTLIAPGVSLTTGAGNGKIMIGADIKNSANRPAPAGAVETIAFTGAQGSLVLTPASGSYLYVDQGSPSADNHNIILDMSGLGTFQMLPGANSRFLVANAHEPRSHGTAYLAMTNIIVTGNDFQVGYLGAYSNSLPIACYLGQTNWIQTGYSGVGSDFFTVGSTGCTNALVAFNPAFLGGATPPVAYLSSPVNNGRIDYFTVCQANGFVSGYALCDFTGGYVNALVNNLRLGLGGTAATNALGVLSFDNGLIDANTVTVGNQTVNNGGTGVGVLNIGANATLKVNNVLTLGAVTGTVTPGTAGTININGGTLIANLITNGLGSASSLNLTNATLQFPTVYAGNTTSYCAYVTSLVTGGNTNLITVNLAGAPAGYPFTSALVKYSGSIGGKGFNFGVSIPGSQWQGYLSNNVASSEIDLVVTAGPSVLAWTGADPSGNWDVGTTTDWSFGTTPVTYHQFDFTRFDDTATGTTTVNLTTTLTPSSLTVSNNAKTYTFSGSGALSGALAGGLIKQGTGTLVLNETGGDTFTGGVNISGGVLQLGNGVDVGGGSLGAAANAVVNNGALVVNRLAGDTLTVPNPISGTGALTNNGGTLVLAGANTFSGPAYVAPNATLQLGSSGALGSPAGSTILANGATLDLNGNNPGAEPITAVGNGSGSGAIINNNSAGTPILTAVTLAGNTTFGGTARWDLRGTLSSGGQPYSVTLTPSGYTEWRDLAADAALGTINVNSGTLGWVGSTTGGTNGSLNIAMSATLIFYNSSANVNLTKPLNLSDGSTVANGGGANVISGPIALNGYDTFNVGGTSLTLSGPLSGNGTVYKSTGNSPLVISGNSPAFTGSLSAYFGKLILNGLSGGTLTSLYGTTVAGTGTNNGLVDIAGAFLPGDAGVAGTFTAAGGLTLESTATITNDLSATTSGANDLVRVIGDLTPNDTTIYLNLSGGTLEGGRPYTLFTYTGNLNGSFAGVATASTTPYTLLLTNVTTTNPKQIQVIVTGGAPSLLAWNNASGTGEWDVQGSLNWTNLSSHVSPDQFFSADAVLLDDSITNSPYPVTTLDIAAGQIVSPSVITNNSTTNYTISGAGKLSDGASLVKLGSSTLTIASTNDFSGPISLLGGKLVISNSAALGSTTGTLTISNNATLDLNGATLGAKPILVSGVGQGTNGAIINSAGPIYDDGSGLTALTLKGDAIFGGPTRWDLGGASGGTLSTGGKSNNLTYAGNPVGSANATYWEWYNVNADTNLANINILAGELGVKGTTTLGNATNTVTISDGGQMTFWGGSGYAKNFYVKSNGTMLVRYDGPTFNFNVTLEGGAIFTTVNAAKTFTGTFTLLGLAHLQSGNNNSTFSNVISGPGGFYWDNYDHQLVFTATNTYSGPTIIGNGLALALSGNGSIANSTPIVFVGTDATSLRLDVSGRTDQTFTLASGQTLSGTGRINGALVETAGATISPGTNSTTLGIINADKAVTLNGTTALKLIGANADQVQSAVGITFGGTLNLSFNAGTLAAGNSFKLFTAPSFTGSFQLSPATPGSGLAWDTSSLAVNGTLKVVSATVSRPSITTITLASGNVVLSGTNGTPGSTYYVLTSTNVALPLSSWTALATNQFNGNGAFSWTNPVSGSAAQRFYLLQAQ